MNALFLIQFFGKEANDSLPSNMEEVRNNLHKNKLIICGALRFSPHSTSDTTAARLASYLNTYFINMTNVKGLYNSNPLTNKNAKFIPKTTWKDIERRANKIKHAPGQHFVLDQGASTIIRKYKVNTYIIGRDLKNLDNLLNNRKFIGTIISG